VFGSAESKALWLADADIHIKEASRRWSGWFGSELDGSFNTQCFQGYSGPAIQQSEEVLELVAIPEDLEMNACNEGSLSTCCSVTELPILGGMDPVSYRDATEGSIQPTPGLSTISSVVHDKYKVLFSSDGHKSLFDENPNLYLPVFGGFDAFSLPLENSFEVTSASSQLGPSIDLNYWTVFDDRLFFFKSEMNKRWFLDDPEHFIAEGDLRWSTWFQVDNDIFNTHCFTTN
jgi:YHS domain-containing protein